MLAEAFGLTVKAGIKSAIKASEVADIGAIKPKGFGTLIRKSGIYGNVKKETKEAYLSGFPTVHKSIKLSNASKMLEMPYLSLRYNEVAKECSEYLFDYNITPQKWENANLEQRVSMLCEATEIMTRELELPEEWVDEINPIIVSGKEYEAQASCIIAPLDNGGVAVIGVPELTINQDCLKNDYFEAMSTVYHEMVHMKQYSSIDCINPELTEDSRLLDLIDDLKNRHNDSNSRVSYLFSPYEAEAWAQGLYFKEMLEAVSMERYG